MSNVQLNLARAWRSKTFNELIGQDLAVRLIKNTLYKKQFFPVYLFAGQRGCGKTSLARLFASAINCASLDVFSSQPRTTILPCQTCNSCRAMQATNHPDFYEIDAASHTGVDHIRTLIEGASFLPALGSKKIYLIDEAHMLSKAAFNAFLKVLEEPPASVVFMLATTDPHKILDTVRSRCFQLFLQPVAPGELVKHLAHVCQKEALACDEKALWLIAYEAEGSVRDALNCLERVRMAYSTATSTVTTDHVLTLLGDISYEHILALYETLYTGTMHDVLAITSKLALHTFSASYVWKKCVEVARGLLWVSAGLEYTALALYHDRLTALAQKHDAVVFTQALEVLYQAEPLFVKTQRPHALLEMVFMQVHAVPLKKKSNTPALALAPVQHVTTATITTTATPLYKNTQATTQENTRETTRVNTQKNIHHDKEQEQPKTPDSWSSFIQKLAACDDPLALSVFSQAHFEGEQQTGVLIAFSQELVFFKELLEQTKTQWQPILEQVFGYGKRLDLRFTSTASSTSTSLNPAPLVKTATKTSITAPSDRQPVAAYSAPAQKSSSYKAVERPRPSSSTVVNAVMNVRDAQAWPKVHTVLRLFSGIVTQEHTGQDYYN